MKKLGWILISLLAVSSAFAAPPHLAPKGKGAVRKDKDARVDAIWEMIENRIVAQNDLWFKVGDYPAVINLYRFLNSEDPTDYEYATNLGWMLENDNQYDQALVVYVRFHNDNPNDKDSSFPEANFYFMKKAYARVIPLLSPAIDLKPQRNAYSVLAHSYEKLGMLPDAVKVWKKLLVDYPKDLAGPPNLRKDERLVQTQNTGGA
jgi:tetratricopeptide (TPR) repeat protein